MMIDQIRQVVSDEKFQTDVIDFLMSICSVNTTPNADIMLMAENEKKVFEIIKERLLKCSFENAVAVEKVISPAIQDHPAFSQLHFTKTDACPGGLRAEEVYKERFNLLYFVNGQPSDRGINTAINAHIDVVTPFFPPVKKGNILLGRGIIDDKGGVATIYGALKVLDRLNREKRIVLKNKLTAMFVVEEETGGNGSLDLAVDKELKKRYDSIIVMECCGNRIYPANRGAVWFWCGVDVNTKTEATTEKLRPLPFESMIFSVLEMQKEGDAIKEESDHPLFPHKPVQTCNGILGPFGEHPSRICGYVSFMIRGANHAQVVDDLMACLKHGIDLYIAKYGDKTRFFDLNTGKPRIEKHFDADYDPDNKTLCVKAYGSAGHMGSILEHDAAIVKWAYMTREVFMYKINSCPYLEMELENHDSSEQLILEGGQGFLPTHSIDEIMKRMRNAFMLGTRKYLQFIGAPVDALRCRVTFDKLHNNAYSCNPDSSTVKNAWESAIQAGIIDKNDRIRGWDVSCDARLFAGEYPDMPVITSGPGELRFAHADDEQLSLPDLFNAIIFTSLFLLRETGSSLI